MFKKNDSGMAIVGAILLMLVLVVLGQAMIMLTNHESIQEVRGRLKDSALYIADAGIEKAIKRIKEDNSDDFSGTIGSATGDIVGGYNVTVTDQGSNRYKIESTGYIPSTSSYKARRKIEAEVEVAESEPYTDGIAVRAMGTVTLDTGITYRGGIWSNDVITIGDGVTITDSEAGAGDGSIYSAYNGAGDGVVIGSNVSMSGSDPYIKANETVSGTVATGDPTIIAPNAGLTPIPESDFPAFDVDSLLAEVKPENVYTGTPQNISGTFDLNNDVHEFQGGVYFDDGTVFVGSGTIIVTGGSGTRGIEIDANLGSESDYAVVNLVVTGGTWDEWDIYIDKNAYIAGALVGSTDISVDASVHIREVIDTGGDDNLDADITIEYAEPEWQLPGGGTGGVTVISWIEKTPD